MPVTFVSDFLANPSMGSYVTRPCLFCKETTEVVLNKADVAMWRAGRFVQDVWPNQSVEFRELLISGTHGPCWDKAFPEEEGEPIIEAYNEVNKAVRNLVVLSLPDDDDAFHDETTHHILTLISDLLEESQA